MKKRDVLELLDTMPEELDADKLIYALWLRRKIERAMNEPDDQDISHEELERLSEEWSA